MIEIVLLAQQFVPDLARLANDASIAANVRNRFPHPYTVEDAVSFVNAAVKRSPACEFAILLDGAFAGVCGLIPGEDVYARSAEVGYWVGAPFRGKGAASAGLQFLGEEARRRGFVRLFAGVYEWNPASMRVLEKSGFVRESIQRHAITKNGRTGDQHLFVRLFQENLSAV